MEILKRFKTWLSFKKGDEAETKILHENDERSVNRRKRSVKRNADPVSEEESVRRKHHRRSRGTESVRKAEIEEQCNVSLSKENDDQPLEVADFTPNNSSANEYYTEDENEDNTILNDYEIKTIGSIYQIREKCRKFDREIETFADITGSRQFLYVDENLQSHIEKLDGIDAKESTKIRKERKSAVKYICLLIDRLEAVAKRNQEQLKPRQLKVAPISRQQFLEGKTEE